MEGDKNNAVLQMCFVETGTTGQKWQQKIPKLQSKTIIKKTQDSLFFGRNKQAFYDLGTMLDGITWNNISRNTGTGSWQR